MKRGAGQRDGFRRTRANSARTDVAIIGMACRFPQARSPAELWSVLENGRNVITHVPARRLKLTAWSDDGSDTRGATLFGGFLDNVDCFDAAFFGVSPREAELMDPQQRILLELAWHLLEDARVQPSSLAGTDTGVFIGACNADYGELLSTRSIDAGLYEMTGTAGSILPNRLSYFFDWHGPSVLLDTACSSSLVAVHMAARAIRSGECAVAVAGGVNVCWTKRRFDAFDRAGMLSKDGQCKTFDSQANGYVRSEGVGAILLKDMSAAVRDGNRIHAVIKGSAINHGGKTRGLTVTSPAQQRALLLAAWRDARVHPDTLGYIELHGAGTSLGDPIEFLGLRTAFERLRDTRRTEQAESDRCALGSIKTNVGHLESAAGIAGLIKVLLAIRHRVIPANINFQELNSLIRLEESAFHFLTEKRHWQARHRKGRELPRRAGVSSFGMGGAYAHVVVQEYKRAEPGRLPVQNRSCLIVLSAHDAARLRACAALLGQYVMDLGEASCSIVDLAYSLQVSRDALQERVAFIACDRAQLIDMLQAFSIGAAVAGTYFLGRANKVGGQEISEPEPDHATVGRRIESIAASWVKGERVEWKTLYTADETQLIDLPLYPFAAERYWTAADEDVAVGRTESHPSEQALSRGQNSRIGADTWLFSERWRACPLAPREGRQKPVPRIVVMLSDSHLQETVRASIAKVSGEAYVVFVARAEAVPRSPEAIARPSCHASRSHEADAFRQTFATIVETHGDIDAIWYLWPLEDEQCHTDQRCVVRMLQGLARAGVKRASVLLAGEYRNGMERCYLESWIGYERSISRSLPGLQIAVIHEERKNDQARPSAALENPDAWVQRLWAEMESSPLRSALYIEGVRHILQVGPLELSTDVACNTLRRNGTYLITGGLGGLGYALAAYLARNYSANLVLTGRSELDPDKEGKLQTLRAHGVQVMYLSADIAHGKDVDHVLQCARERFGPVHGVVHAAGVDGGTSLVTREENDIAAVWGPKIEGTRALHDALQADEIDFLCCFSSSSAILGDFGSCDYAVANRFQLAHASYVPGKALAICWPLWSANGMRSSGDEGDRLYLKSSGQRALDIAEGMALFERSLELRACQGIRHVVVMAGERARVHRILGIASADEVAASERPHRRRELRGLSMEQSLLWELRELACAVLKLPRERLDAERNFADFGFDSLLLAQFAAQMRAHFAIEIYPSIFFSQPTLQQLGRHLMLEHADALSRCYPNDSDVRPALATTPSQANAAPPAAERQVDVADRKQLQQDCEPEPIAIVGMSGRFPQCRSIDELWQVLMDGSDVVQEIPPDRFAWRDYYQEPGPGSSALVPTDRTNSKWLGVVPGADEFDPLFFEISPREARLMDPRQRLLLQESFKALEDAGYGKCQLAAQTVGMFVGVEEGDYRSLLGQECSSSVTANHDAILASRLNYFLDLRGPALAINTACSSGLVAAHQACMSLQVGECDAAVAAAVNLILSPDMYLSLSQAGMLSPLGRCRAFDQRADGMVPGEAVVAVVLKRLSRARLDGDRIYATIIASGINNDGKTNGLIAPNGEAQASLVRSVHQRAGIDSRRVEYIITHGTGTRLGDPVEVGALNAAFAHCTFDEPFCALTSTKSNFGHTFAASGLVSLVSMALALRNQRMPASLHCEQPSDYVDWSSSPFYVNREPRRWPRVPDRQRLGAVSAFGISGTNAHMVLAAYDEELRCEVRAPCYLLAVSAKTAAALQTRIDDLIRALRSDGGTDQSQSLAALSYTLLQHRHHYEYRCALVVTDPEQALSLLEELEESISSQAIFYGKARRDEMEQPALQRCAAQLVQQSTTQTGRPDEYRESLTALAALYSHGCLIDWSGMYGGSRLPRASLPTYSFARERYWPHESRGVDASSHLSQPDETIQRSSSSAPGEALHEAAAAMHADRVMSGERRPTANRAVLDASAGQATDAAEMRRLQDKVLHRLKAVVSAVTNVTSERLDAHEPLSSYGIDSISIVRMNEKLARAFMGLPKTLFFEYRSLAELCRHLVAERTGECMSWTGAPMQQGVAVVQQASEPARVHDRLGSKVPIDVFEEDRAIAVGTPPAQEIAIIGLSGRYPGAENVDQFWKALQAGTDCITEIPPDRWALDEFYEPDVEKAIEQGRSYGKWGGFIEGFAHFDPLFFGISPREASNIDPQERLFLQASWEVLEDAGYCKASLAARHQGRVGVYVGITRSGFDLYGPALREQGIKAYPRTSFSSVANRVSYLLNLNGPSLPIDTMCSASLTAIHEACEHLARGECEVAIAGGVNLCVHPSGYVDLSAMRMLSTDGRCRSFGAGGNGYVPGEGVGAVLLKPLYRAIEDRDHIYGVIRGTSINHGGRTNGYTVPNPNAQRELILTALQRARVDPRAISYVEAHGSGTVLGDPIEIAALAQAFGSFTADIQYCAIGSVKSNIGHLESAAGIAGLSKVLLQMKHRTLVASLHADTLNPYIDFARTPFVVQRTQNEWMRPVLTLDGQQKEYPRIAAISAFGAGGANAHLIVEEYSEAAATSSVQAATGPSRPVIIVLSAKTAERLYVQATRLLEHIEVHSYGDSSLTDLSYTLQVGREALEHRLAFVVTSMAMLTQKLAAYVRDQTAWRAIEECHYGQQKQNRETLSVLSADDEFQGTLMKWVENGKHPKLLELWSKGLAFDWSKLYEPGAPYAHSEPRRISLPTYPFARERYWFAACAPENAREETPLRASTPDAFADLSAQLDRSDTASVTADIPTTPNGMQHERTPPMYFTEAWQPCEHEAQEGVEIRVLAVLLSDPLRQAELREAVARTCASTRVVFIARANNPPAARAAGLFDVRCKEVASYRMAFERVLHEYGAIDAVWHLWTVERPDCIDDAVEIACLLQGLIAAGTKGVKVLLAGEYASALQRCHLESWIGYARSIQRAAPEMQVAVIHAQHDAGSKPTHGLHAMRHWSDRLWRALWPVEVESALYIGDQRHVLRTEQLTVVQQYQASVVRHGGAYLITGGLGGLGYQFAEYLARTYAAKLVLTGRSPVGKSTEAKLEALEKLGGEAMYASTDVSDGQAMRAAIAAAVARFGTLHGVIHAAGISDPASLAAKDLQTVAAVLAAKVAGTVVLDELLGSDPLDFVCYFSSTAIALGDVGSCDYAVANRFTLGYSKYVNNKAIAIAWPLWADGRMGFADSQATELYLRASGQRALETSEGMAVFEQLLRLNAAAAVNHAVVLAGVPDRLHRLMGRAPRSPDMSARQSSTVTRHRPELQGLTSEQRVLYDLKELAGELLRLPPDKLDAQENLAEFGFDSILLAGFATRLSRHFGIAVQPSIFFSFATLSKLAAHLAAEHVDALKSHYQDDADERLPLGPIRNEAVGARAPTPRSVVAPAESLEPIAIVGMSGRFPLARSIDELWEILANGKEAVQEIPLDRFDWREYYEVQDESSTAVPSLGKTNSKWLGMLPGAYEFDPLFFEISPREARLTDPRQRLLLQESFKALEDAGFGPRQLNADRIGMFVGVEQGDYQPLLAARGVAPPMVATHDGILAARLSYFLNLRGPAIALNTACSSGLVAAHQACQSLRMGECDAAIAASVALVLAPETYIAMSELGMLSPHGRCHAFDRRADGMVPAEAVVALVLKPLSRAQADGDLIHAVIRGSGINYDGKTNGLTAPSGTAQEALIRQVYERAGVNPRDIEYVVAHGTGTRLGDPIEVNALRSVFAETAASEPFCALTSTKTNLGHTLAASGLVSLVGLVQSLRHEVIPASLHCEQLSDYIDWDRSPFFVNRRSRAWQRRSQGRRLGAVSAFGMSGTNAHMVVEGYDEPNAHEYAGGAPCHLITLSAKTADALRRRAEDLIGVLRDPRRNWDAGALASLSHTLLNGRQHFAHRCALVTVDARQAAGLLEKLGSEENLPTCLQGKVARDFTEQPSIRRYVDEVLTQLSFQVHDEERYRESLLALAELYCSGYEIRGETLYGTRAPKRMSLPTYPFTREKYELERSAGQEATSRDNAGRPRLDAEGPVCHPFLHRNTSNIHGLKFSSTFDGREFFLNDHVVLGSKVLPGVCYLEMALAALDRCFQGESPAGPARMPMLRNVVWLQPIVVTAATQVNIELTAAGDDGIEFAIDTVAAVHAQGRAAFVERPDTEDRLDTSELQRSCVQPLDVASCYQAFSDLGLDYGTAHRSLASVQIGRQADGEAFVLAQLQLPDCVADSASRFALHPSLLDGALQAAIAFLMTAEHERTHAAPRLPFALDSLELRTKDVSPRWVHVRRTPLRGSATAHGRMERFDIDIGDASGRLCIRMKGLAARSPDKSASAGPPVTTLGTGDVADAEIMYLARRWQTKLLLRQVAQEAAACSDHHVLLDAAFGDHLASLQARLPRVSWSLLGTKTGVAEQMIDVGLKVFAATQRILAGKPQRPVLLQLVLAVEPSLADIGTACGGLLRSAHQESSKFLGQVIALPAGTNVDYLLSAVRENASEVAVGDVEIRYVDGLRQAIRLAELNPTGAPSQSPVAGSLPMWKKNGVYLITGGLGGLGTAFAREIARSARGARIILAGRSTASPGMEAELAALSSSMVDARLEYKVLDVNDELAVEACVAQVINRHGGLDGILHAAGVTHDGLIVNKTEHEFAAVLAPKVRGTVNLDRATQSLALDWFILFSSLSGVVGNPGQADYAVANAFMDRFACHRNELVRRGVRHGKTLSVSWPLWANGGMQVHDVNLEHMQRRGLQPLRTEVGVALLSEVHQFDESHVAIVCGDRRRILSQVLAQEEIAETDATDPSNSPVAVSTTVRLEPAVPGEAHAMLGRIQEALVERVALQLHVQVADIDTDAQLSEFGFDSISLTAFVNALNQAYDLDLSPTVFFEFPTLRSLADYLATDHASAFARHSSERTASQRPAAPPESYARVLRIAEAAAAPRTFSTRFKKPRVEPSRRSAAAAPTRPQVDEPIAIVGMSGCFPGAPDLDAFWENLRAGVDCITEVPAQRWDWRAIYGDPQRDANKTNIRWGGFIDGIDEFDPLFFGISPQEAAAMDPQQRLLLMYAWKAIEDAGHSPQSLSGTKTGVFVGTDRSCYGRLLAAANVPLAGYSSTGVVPSIGPNRLSYLLNLRGPSEPIETACSSSLVAIHRAVRAIHVGDCDMALVGGVNTIVSEWGHITFSKAGMLSEDGRCKPFSNRANGYARGEGVGMLFLKRLSQAERDGDPIYALIRASAENHGGRANSLTAPNPKAQAELIETAYAAAHIDPRTVTYIEAHGTGTTLGDPIEISGLKQAFAAMTNQSAAMSPEDVRCGIGSVKANIGHLELAAGVAGAIKVVLQLKHRLLVRTLHCEEINPLIDLRDSPFYIVQSNLPWPALRSESGEQLPRLAGVSSFGFGGVNAHVVIEEYCPPPRTGITPVAGPSSPVMIVLSARTEDQLREQAAQLLRAIRTGGYEESDLANIAYTLQVGREAMVNRLAFTATCMEDVDRMLSTYMDGDDVHGVHRGDIRKSREDIAPFAEDEDMRDAMHSWAIKRKFDRLLALWVKGLPVEWNRFYGGVTPARLRLPTYPFAKERYWIPASDTTDSTRMPGAQRPHLPAEFLPAASGSSDGSAWSSKMPPGKPEAMMLLARWEAEEPVLHQEWPVSSACVLVIGGTSEQQEAIAARYRCMTTMRIEEVANSSMRLDAASCVDHVLWIADPSHARDADDQALIAEQELGVLNVFALIKAMLAAGYGTRELGWTVVTWQAQQVRCEEIPSAGQASIHGLIGSLAKEYPRWRVRAVDLPSNEAWPLEAVLRLQWDEQGDLCAYRDGEWHRQKLVRFDAIQEAAQNGYREGGVYVVVGGAGGIGEVFSEYLLMRYRARVVWLGRREADDSINRKMARLNALGGSVQYLQTDAADEVSMHAAHRYITESYGAVHGVIHSAIELLDQGLANMDEARFRAGLRAKVDVSVRLGQLFAAQASQLDFVMFFSSIQSFTKAAGQSNYAAGCTFMDAYAQWLRASWPCAVKVMNWGYWGTVGVVSDAAYQRRMERLGVGSIEPVEAMAALEYLLTGPHDELVFLRARDPQKMVRLVAEERIISGAAVTPSLIRTLAMATLDLDQAM